MMRWLRPSSAQIGRFLKEQKHAPFSYSHVGATQTTPPQGHRINHARAILGHGEASFTAACAALKNWEMFKQPWTRIEPQAAPLRENEVVAILARVLGVWFVNACRIIYVVDEAGDTVRRFGFGFGTLAHHVAQGEERFLVEWNQSSGEVHFEVLSFCKPRFWGMKLLPGLAMQCQKQFAQGAVERMRRAVAASIKPEAGKALAMQAASR
jgi:uncharacterized protein (UPF0548 family)